MEAVASGLPTIVPEDDIAYEILFENNAAAGFKRGDVNNLSETILKLIENRKMRFDIGVNSTYLGEEILSWGKIAEKSISIYLNR